MPPPPLPGAVTDLIRATPEEDILRRDIYDRAPIFKWSEGLVGLLGDSAHAMQVGRGQAWGEMERAGRLRPGLSLQRAPSSGLA